MKKLKYIHLFEIFSLDNLETLNEDNLEVKNIAKQIYSWLKKNGVNAKLVAQVPSQPTNKSIGSELTGGDNDALVMYWDDVKTKQTQIQIQLVGGNEDLVGGVEKNFLSSFTNLEQYDRNAFKTAKAYNINFRLREKTTNKGGLVGNTNKPKEEFKKK
jgi:hypothetical protein